MIMADKGFNIQNECAARCLTLYVPPEKSGQAQMPSHKVRKTKKVAHLRIIVEQVIRRIKSFRILKHELPLSLLPLCDKIVTVICGLCNLQDPIYKD